MWIFTVFLRRIFVAKQVHTPPGTLDFENRRCLGDIRGMKKRNSE